MGQNKEQLKKLLEFIETLSKQKGNEWFVEELKERFSSGSLMSNSKIDEIYELCIEKILREHAEQFYKDFPIKDIIEQLVEDFIRMEQFRRKNKFEDFCMALYQQVECVVNKIGADQVLNEVAQKMMGYPAYTNGAVENRQGEFQIAKLLFIKKAFENSKSPVSAQSAIDKFRCILYFVCYKANMQNNEYNKYINTAQLVYELYQYRNLNHRGSTPTESQQMIYDKINPLKNVYYFKLLGEFAEFIEKVCIGYPISSELVFYANGLLDRPIMPDELKTIGFVDPSRFPSKFSKK